MNKIERLSLRNLYTNPHFSLCTPKNVIKNLHVMLTFTVASQELATVWISRREAVYVLRKFKKNLDTRRQTA